MTIGIDLGTTNSLVGAMDSGLPVLFAGLDGKRLTPSAVCFPENAEARLKADEMLPAVATALAATDTPPEELEAIRHAEADVRAALEARSLRGLKSALAALDTEPLAARLLEATLAQS